MKPVEFKCPRCGKVHEFNYRAVIKGAECSHCHYKVVLSAETNKRRKRLGYAATFAVILVLSLIISFLTSLFNLPQMVVIASIIVLGVLSASVTEPMGDYLTYRFYGYTFENARK